MIPGLGRFPGEGNGNPLQYSCLENFMDRGIWCAIVHGITKSQTWLSAHTHTHTSFSKLFWKFGIFLCFHINFLILYSSPVKKNAIETGIALLFFYLLFFYPHKLTHTFIFIILIHFNFKFFLLLTIQI